MNKHAFGSSIPVLRMLCEERTLSFYVNFLGYEVEWKHRFVEDDPVLPLYIQIRRGEAVIHIDGHAVENAAVAEARIPVADYLGYEEELSKRCEDREKPEAVFFRRINMLVNLTNHG